MAAQALSFVEKLKGRENYAAWKFHMKALLKLEDQWDVVNGSVKIEEAKDKDRKALSKISLLVDSNLIHHIEKCDSAKQAWDTIQTLFEDSGLTRRVSLLRQLILTRLDNCSSMEDYVNQIVSTAQRLRDIKFDISEEWIGTLLLAGLPDDYRPMIMGLENSGTPITADSIKVKLLQDVKVASNRSTSSIKDTALYSHRFNVDNRSKDTSQYDRSKDSQYYRSKGDNINKHREVMKCYNCNRPGHIASKCRSKVYNSDQHKKKAEERKSKALLACMYTDKPNSDPVWYLDSCASVHLTKENTGNNIIKSESNIKIYTANNQPISTKHVSDVDIPLVVNGETDLVKAHEVHYAPDIATNLLSVSQITNKGNKVVFDKYGGKIYDSSGELIACATQNNGIYQLDTATSAALKRVCAVTSHEELWHRRLGHLSRKNMNILQDVSTGIKNLTISKSVCEICASGKQTRLPFKPSKFRAKQPLELVHMDLCGPMETSSLGGNKYFMALIDDYSRYTHVYFLKSKDQAFDVFKEYCSLVENQMDRKIKTIRSDNGTEFINDKFYNFLRNKGIRHQTTVRFTPQQNSVAERANRKILDKARCLLQDSGLPKNYWAEATSTAVYLNNRSPTKPLKGRTPYEAWYGTKPNLGYLRVFGCEAMVQIPQQLRKKWDARSEKNIFIGYCSDTKGYRLINPVTKKVTISRDVIFLENKLLKNSKADDNKMEPEVDGLLPTISEEERPTVDLTLEDSSCQHSDDESPFLGFEDEYDEEPDAQKPRRSARQPKPKVDPNFVSYFMADSEPLTLEEALKRPDGSKWKEAINEELESFKTNDTYEWTKLPPEKKALKTKWIFKMKNGNLENPKYKARLVVKGCSQRPGVDYEETFSPVVKYSSLRYLFALAARDDLDITHMDVKTAYLYGHLDEEIYVLPPNELKNKPKNSVWRLKKAMYGLKQSGRCWNRRINEVLVNEKFKQSQADPCIYYRHTKKILTVVAIYVDDLFIFTNDKETRCSLQKRLEREFHMKYLGEAKNCLGMKITRDRRNRK